MLTTPFLFLTVLGHPDRWHSFRCYWMSTVPVHTSAPVATPTSFSPGVNLPKSLLGITIKANILVGCTRSGIAIEISSIDTTLVRSQFESSPVITILRTVGISPALSFRKAGAGSTDTTKHPSSGIVVVVLGTTVVVVGTAVVVVVDSSVVVVVLVVVIRAKPKFTEARPVTSKVYGLLSVVKKYPAGSVTDSV